MINLGPDYHHCKGCLRCVEVCPTKAITLGIEREHEEKILKDSINDISLIDKNISFDNVGVNSWVESVSYTTNSEN